MSHFDIETLERYWQVFPGVRAALFEKADRAGYSQLRVSVGDVKSTIFGHAEFTAGAAVSEGLRRGLARILPNGQTACV